MCLESCSGRERGKYLIVIPPVFQYTLDVCRIGHELVYRCGWIADETAEDFASPTPHPRTQRLFFGSVRVGGRTLDCGQDSCEQPCSRLLVGVSISLEACGSGISI